MRTKSFQLSTTSFILADHIVPNVEFLSPYFDQIELLVFESQPSSVLPSKQVVDDLLALSEKHGVIYNVHLPVDVSLSRGSAEDAKKACDTLLTVMDRFSRLNVSTHTLHLELPDTMRSDIVDAAGVQTFRETLENRLTPFVSCLAQPEQVSIETLDYPFEWIAPVVRDFNLRICLDIGHALVHGHDWQSIAHTQKEKIAAVHLHGVAKTAETIKDHTSLDRLTADHMAAIVSWLETYHGVVSIEVFNRNLLNRSLACLSTYFKQIPGPL